MNGSGENLLKAISSDTRLSILELLSEGDKHISGLAREIGISVPVAAKHVKILEKAELIERKKFGNTHMISIKLNNVYSFLDRFAENRKLEVEEGTSLLEALKNVAAVEVREMGDRIKVVSTDGEEGFYVYEVDGKFSDKTVDEYKFYEDAIVEWKKLIPVTKKRLLVNIRR
ncbi:ArsR family transcriptional regulator [Methanosarcina sp. 2.H.T.1A.6]|uniref:ArsR/SmtB family transcription factor n=1 Tax=unclassified Methanosarcina TaxID=2644672 RepID=UPI000621F0C1|nr:MULTISPECIES: winged helix-turn-helix domain-containing protein [unclassified Methanosarcina]KKG16188.1 ArsR family transcriptional regulator [Methanosarcina sp. 2.H.T.1A.3]KKG23092.1 ArsR family transcriptional regulator [Methanosarcina sp. 2.H.T.1A.6]KKG26315.1 ArsR family transcriptional regulator [Methanosarcina sp. 2.H.T.1A.8]KKG26822.1 ArsR family transcriptional regulator [Methanosarcina sp. 2.H.T.1A.15]KKH46486.1 ArsR family transcriptional regulator [Methanosarcina sp. 1.H.A.2.2]